MPRLRQIVVVFVACPIRGIQVIAIVATITDRGQILITLVIDLNRLWSRPLDLRSGIPRGEDNFHNVTDIVPLIVRCPKFEVDDEVRVQRRPFQWQAELKPGTREAARPVAAAFVGRKTPPAEFSIRFG